MEARDLKLEVNEIMRSQILDADAASLPVMDNLQVNPKDRKADKGRKIATYSEGSPLWVVEGMVVMVNCVGMDSPTEAMDGYFQKMTRVSI